MPYLERILHQQKREGRGKPKFFLFPLIDTIISIKTIGFLSAIVNYLISESYS